MKGLSPRRGRHKDDLIILPQFCIQPIQIADVGAIHKNIEMPAEIAVGTDQVEFDGRILLDHIFDQFMDRRGRHRELGLVVHIVFHHVGKTDVRHRHILLRVGCFCLAKSL